MASGEAEPLQYTTTVLRVSIHCEGCKKKVKKVLHGIEGVYKVTVDAAQHKVIVTGSVGADGLIRRLNKAGKQAALWPAPAAAEDKKKPEEATAAAGEVSKDVVADKADAKPKEAAKGADKPVEAEEGSSAKKPEKDSKGSSGKKGEKPDNKGSDDKKQEKAEAAKQQKDGDKKQANSEAAEAKEKKGSPSSEQPAREASAAEDGEDGGSAKKGGKKKKNKQQQQHKDGGGGEGDVAVTDKKPTPQPAIAAPAAAAPLPAQFPGPERPHGGAFPYYAAQPVMSYNVAHPSASVSYYAPAPAMPVPPPHQVPYGYPPYPHMMPMPPPPEYMYGPPGMRASPPQESYNNMFNEENANSCSLM